MMMRKERVEAPLRRTRSLGSRSLPTPLTREVFKGIYRSAHLYVSLDSD
jgi:hypothetical protein